MSLLHNLLDGYVTAGILRYEGRNNGIDTYTPLQHPWMDDIMNTQDPLRPCGCNPLNHQPQCDGGDDEED